MEQKKVVLAEANAPKIWERRARSLSVRETIYNMAEREDETQRHMAAAEGEHCIIVPPHVS